MTKIFRNRLVIVLLCSLLALGALLLYARSIRSEAEQISVVRMAANVTKGEVINESQLEVVTVGGYNLDSTVVKNKQEVIGKYAATDLVKGSLVLKANLSENILSAADRLQQLDGSHVAYSVTVKEFSNALSDKLTAGDIVSLYICKDGKAIQSPELTYVEVLATTTANGVDRQDREDGSDNLATATLLVTTKQVLLLTEYEDNAEIHFALVYRGDSETAQMFLDKQNEVNGVANQH